MHQHTAALHIHADASRTLGPMPRFWRATGFANAACLFHPAYRRQLQMIAALPHRGIEHVRIHRLLDLVTSDKGPDGAWRYDFAKLDEGLDFLVSLGLKPFFELMGNPSKRFRDFNDSAQLERWRALIQQLAARLIERYGQAEVEAWYFETWNEPDCPTWWKQFHDDPPSLGKYYDACEAGLHAVNGKLRLGGPGGQGNLNDTTKAFLAHCDAGVNHFTGERGTRLDFISVHEKGATMTEESIDPDADATRRREQRFIDYVAEHHPRLRRLPFMNNEADPQIGWGARHRWRAEAYYPAFAARMIDDRLRCFVNRDDAPPYEMLVNDNGFVGTWGQRTLTTRMGSNEHAEAGQFELLPKPIFHLMGMLTRLRGERCHVSHATAGDGDVGVIAVRGEGRLSLLLYHHKDAIAARGWRHIDLTVEGLGFGLAWLRHEQLADDATCAFALWQAMGSPAAPSSEQARLLRAAANEPTVNTLRPIAAREGRFRLNLTLPLPGVSLVQLLADDDVALPAPAELHTEAASDSHGRPACWLAWRSGGTDAPDATEWIAHHRIETRDAPDDAWRAVRTQPAYLNTALLTDADRLGPRLRVVPVNLRGQDGPAAAIETPPVT